LFSRGLQLPPSLTVLHVEQEVVGNDVTALNSVLECDTERQRLLDEEKQIASNLHVQRSVLVDSKDLYLRKEIAVWH
jgi:hypothetical protein